MRRTIRHERRLAHPPALVWRAVSEPELLSAWFMATDLQPVVGRSFTFRMNPQRGWDGITHCEVLAVEPPRRIAFSYRGQATGEKVAACAGVQAEAAMRAGRGIFAALDTVLEFTVTPDGDGTRLTLEHRGFSGLKLVLVSLVLGAGWGRVLKRLPPVLHAAARGERPPPRPSPATAP